MAGGITVINQGHVGTQINIPEGTTVTINGKRIDGAPRLGHWAEGKRFCVPDGVDARLTIRKKIQRLMLILGPLSLLDLQSLMRNVPPEDIDLALHDMLVGSEVVTVG